MKLSCASSMFRHTASLPLEGRFVEGEQWFSARGTRESRGQATVRPRERTSFSTLESSKHAGVLAESGKGSRRAGGTKSTAE